MRPELAALTAEAVAGLSNLGLVKRAQREAAQGLAPILSEDDDGAVRATFSEGVVATIPRAGLAAAHCTCGATAVCRHRVALLLAYPAWAAAVESQSAAKPLDNWSPAALTDERLVGYDVVGAHAALDAGLEVELVHQPPTARLPTCTVRFLVPDDLSHVHCDCAVARCTHVPLAVWAFRARSDDGVVHLGQTPTHADVSTPAQGLVSLLLREGVASEAPFAQHFAQARRGAAEFPWILALLAELEAQVSAWHARHASHEPAALRLAMAELVARERAVRRGALSARDGLGLGEPASTTLSQVRLIGLGARLSATADDHIAAQVYLAEPIAGVVLVQNTHWPAKGGGAAATRTVVSGVRLGALASGQATCRKAVRDAQRSITLQGGRQATVTPLADWSALPPHLRWREVRALSQWFEARPPRLLRPRVRAADVVVLEGQVESLRYVPGPQELRAELVDAAGERIGLVRRHVAVAPKALDSLAQSLPAAVSVAGEVRRGGRGLVMEPSAVLTAQGVFVPDLWAPDSTQQFESRGALPIDGSEVTDELAGALSDAGSALDRVVSAGLRHTDLAAAELVEVSGRRLADVGLVAMGSRFGLLAEALRRLLAGAGDEDTVEAWLQAAIRLALAG